MAKPGKEEVAARIERYIKQKEEFARLFKENREKELDGLKVAKPRPPGSRTITFNLDEMTFSEEGKPAEQPKPWSYGETW